MKRHDAFLPASPVQAVAELGKMNPARRRRGKLLSGLYGMLSEIFFVLGLALIGFLISLLGGW